jgi:hypothetical protein
VSLADQQFTYRPRNDSNCVRCAAFGSHAREALCLGAGRPGAWKRPQSGSDVLPSNDARSSGLDQLDVAAGRSGERLDVVDVGRHDVVTRVREEHEGRVDDVAPPREREELTRRAA